jgi:hypothetical protein
LSGRSDIGEGDMKEKRPFANIDAQKFLKLRTGFRHLALQMGDFDKMRGGPLADIAADGANSFYEEIGSVGYQPQTERLEAVIYVNQPSGYGGGLCGNGTLEYVRFFVSANNGATWDDLGVSAVQVWDVPEGTEGRRRLEYAVTRPHIFERWICKRPRILKVRAILSWNAIPPAGNANHTPIWGEVHDTWILVQPKQQLVVGDLKAVVDAKLVSELEDLIGPKTVFAAQAKPVPMKALAAQYKKAEVEPKRFLFPMLAEAHAKPAMFSGGQFFGSIFEEIGVNLADLDLSDLFDPGDGNTSYEELEAIGYDPELDDLVGVIRIKKSAGYSGGTCSNGSIEYVTFWADLNHNGTFETCLGTAQVQVFDVADLPEGGLEFAVHLPARLLRYRQPCQKGPVIVPIRAILSWATPVPCATPNTTPTWGNRLETLVHVRPGREVGTELDPWLSRVGEIPQNFIDGAGYIQNGTAVASGATFNNAPFGGRITLAGTIINGTSATRYRPMIRKAGVGAFVPMPLEPGGITLAITTPGPTTTWTTIHADADGYYAYQDYAANHYVEGNILAAWYTGAAEHGETYELRVDVDDPLDPLNDIESNVVTVHVDNEPPVLTLGFTSLAGDCAHFQENAVFTGEFTIADPHFGSFHFEILPNGPANGVLPMPASGASLWLGGAIADPGVAAGVFTLETGGGTPPPPGPMAPCGYALVLHAYDRTNVNSGYGGNYAKDSIGFCLGNPPQG